MLYSYYLTQLLLGSKMADSVGVGFKIKVQCVF